MTGNDVTSLDIILHKKKQFKIAQTRQGEYCSGDTAGYRAAEIKVSNRGESNKAFYNFCTLQFM